MRQLEEAEFELLESSAEDADGLHMGLWTRVNVAKFEPGEAETRNADAPRPMSDGTAFGRDFRSGRLIALELNAVSDDDAQDPANEALATADAVEAAWSADRVRGVPGAVQVLRWRLGGRARRVYGRARRCVPVAEMFHLGNVPIVADFQCADDLYYSDQRNVTTVGIVPATSGGASWPLLWSRPASGNAGTHTVGGSRATWPTFTITGPVVNPTIVIGGYGELRLNTTLAYDQSLYLDTRPWNRGIRRNDGANIAAALDVRATPLSLLRLPPGSFSVALKGTDLTGTAQLTIEHRDAHSSF